ncbi:hypothetical protein DICVIV_07603 [Dictyocaulus viviparus]|uniref:GDP-fucose pyrophosphorylase domain-containing protein n=1 Tax=Dictyocaulus viviparus TaxID=29172 RepID=A0A0D8XRF8_DICVI|nr:hypothetical protein DICVIV_07603 [Dictyocaulus viviparus]
MAFLRECGVFTCDSLLVVTDACNDVGSAGSALNALLITGSSSESFPLGAAFKPSLKILEKPWIVPDYPIVHAIRNVNKLATNTNRGVWICGTDALWELDELTNFSFNTTEIAAFYFRGDLQHIETHGVYNLDEQGRIKSINYCCSPYVADSPNIVLGLVYLPPALSTRFLSLHSIYPISRSTYYGIDSGALGLKLYELCLNQLSLFFDVILATCLPEAEFVNNIVITEKSDSDRTLLEQSRREIWKRFHVVKCQAYCLPLIEYEYLGGTEQRIEISKQEIINSLHKNILHRISKMIQNHGGEHSTALLMTLMAINKFYDIKKLSVTTFLKTVHVVVRLCLQNVSQCSHPLMLAAEYLALAAHGKGGLRSGPAANSAFTHIFDQIKTAC